MKFLNNKDMLNVKGGAISSSTIMGIIGGVLSFLIGLWKGIQNARRCK